jgi:hypothetical protein
MRYALLTLCFACAALATDEIVSTAQDPHLLAAYINTHPEVDLTPLRAYLGVNDYGVLQPCEPHKCHGEVTDVPGVKPLQAILWIADSFNQYAFWIRYHKDAADAWRLLSAHLVNGKYIMPEYKLSRKFGRPFLVVDGLGTGGTGMETTRESWFDLSLPRSQPVLSYTTQGFAAPGCDQCFIHGVEAIASEVQKNGVAQIRIERTASFETQPWDNSQKPLDLGSRTATAVYFRATTGKFTLSPSLSTATKRVLDTLFDIPDEDWMTNKQFLRFDIANLRRIAATPQSPEAKWLAEFLKTCKTSPQKSEILRLLN